jgi:hypothetical protein
LTFPLVCFIYNIVFTIPSMHTTESQSALKTQIVTVISLKIVTSLNRSENILFSLSDMPSNSIVCQCWSRRVREIHVGYIWVTLECGYVCHIYQGPHVSIVTPVNTSRKLCTSLVDTITIIILNTVIISYYPSNPEHFTATIMVMLQS